MADILHIIHGLTLGGAARSMIATAGNSDPGKGYRHSVVSLLPPEAAATELAEKAGMRIVSCPERQALLREMEAADIVQVHWWNVPEMYELLCAPLPKMRLILFYHVAGDCIPHVITPRLAELADINVPCNPYSYHELDVFAKMDPESRGERVAMVYDAADLSRLDGLIRKPHAGFNVGYIGTVDFLKMHPDFVALASAVRVPGIKFTVCGTGGAMETIRAQAEALGAAAKFEVKGYVEDIRTVLDTMDVYGYPLCEDTYAAAELNLQEVMYAGIPPVVFPYGGVRRLVVNDFTGLVVHSPHEYREALEHLFHHPDERRRLGDNAKNYADQIFGARNAAKKMDRLYERLLMRPKKTREAFASPSGADAGVRVFLETLGDAGGAYVRSRNPASLEDACLADNEIATASRLAFLSGIGAYRGRFPRDPYLRYWAGLVMAYMGNSTEAAVEFMEAIKNGFPHWRVHWHLHVVAEKIGQKELSLRALQHLEKHRPRYREELSGFNANGESSSIRLPSPLEPENQGLGYASEAGAAESREKGRALLEQGKAQEALPFLLSALRASPSDPEAVLDMGKALEASGLLAEAGGLYFTFLDEDPTHEAMLRAHIRVEEKWAAGVLVKSRRSDSNYRKKDYQVTALVSTYGSADFMRECLENLEGQSIAENLEIIVVDAASPQDEGRIVEEFQKTFTNIRYIRTPERIGIYPAWNLALRLAKGRFVTPFSTNDGLNPDAYRLMVDALENNPEVALIYGDSYLTDIPHEKFGAHTPSPNYGGVFAWPEYSFRDLLYNCRVGPHPMWRREVHAQVGYFDGRYKAIGDQDFWLRLGRKYPLMHIPVFTGLAWITPSSLSGQSDSFREIGEIQSKHARAYINYLARLAEERAQGEAPRQLQPLRG